MDEELEVQRDDVSDVGEDLSEDEFDEQAREDMDPVLERE